MKPSIAEAVDIFILTAREKKRQERSQDTVPMTRKKKRKKREDEVCTHRALSATRANPAV